MSSTGVARFSTYVDPNEQLKPQVSEKRKTSMPKEKQADYQEHSLKGEEEEANPASKGKEE